MTGRQPLHPPRTRPATLRAPTIALLATAGLAIVSIVLDTGTERARDLALLIGAPTLYLLTPAATLWLVVTLVVRLRRRSTGSCRRQPHGRDDRNRQAL